MTDETTSQSLDDLDGVDSDFVHLARLALAARDREVPLFLQRVARRYRKKAPLFTKQLTEVLRHGPVPSSPLRGAATPLPVDSDSRLSLAEVEWPIAVDNWPILTSTVDAAVRQLIEERERRRELLEANLYPTRTALFVGPPGVGKTMAARWIAASLELPLVVLNLAAVMSSLLGRTGANVRHVIDYAKQQDCVLLLDEVDAIAKRRDDPADIGELKRLVTVLLQQVDQWPPNSSMLIAATNHSDLLDPAIWRRFDVVVRFELPDDKGRHAAIQRFAGSALSEELVAVLALGLMGDTFADIEILVSRCQRASALGRGTLESCLLSELSGRIASLEASSRRGIAKTLAASKVMSQRSISELTGVSRDTIRKDVLGRGRIGG